MWDEDKTWIKEAALKMSNKELADNIILFLQHANLPDNEEAELAGYKIYIWAENEQRIHNE